MMNGRSLRLVVSNWKMNPATYREAQKLLAGSARALRSSRGVNLVVAPPAFFLRDLAQSSRSRRVAFAAQDISPGTVGASTGNVSAVMAKESGASFVVLGHSERRAKGETNELVAEKVASALSAGLSVILCVGEERRDSHGAYLSFIQEELFSALALAPRGTLRRLIVAYEPIWAIGKSAEAAITPRDLHEMVIFIRKVIAEKAGAKIARAVPILYGGSVEGENAWKLLAEGEVRGLLVGRASLDPVSLQKILALASRRP